MVVVVIEQHWIVVVLICALLT